MEFYSVKNWERFQHYKDRSPPWIKLHFEILTCPDWVMIDDTSKLLMIVCMLIASRNDGKVPADAHYFKRVAYLDKIPNFKPLLECGFLEKTQANASERKQKQADATPETEAYSTEADNEEDSLRSSSSAASGKKSRSSKSKEPAINFNFESKRWENITDEMKQLWADAYPAVDIELELKEMALWLDANPKNKKSNYKRFINTWLGKSQDRAPRFLTGAKKQQIDSDPAKAQRMQALVDELNQKGD